MRKHRAISLSDDDQREGLVRPASMNAGRPRDRRGGLTSKAFGLILRDAEAEDEDDFESPPPKRRKPLALPSRQVQSSAKVVSRTASASWLPSSCSSSISPSPSSSSRSHSVSSSPTEASSNSIPCLKTQEGKKKKRRPFKDKASRKPVKPSRKAQNEFPQNEVIDLVEPGQTSANTTKDKSSSSSSSSSQGQPEVQVVSDGEDGTHLSQEKPSPEHDRSASENRTRSGTDLVKPLRTGARLAKTLSPARRKSQRDDSSTNTSSSMSGLLGLTLGSHRQQRAVRANKRASSKRTNQMRRGKVLESESDDSESGLSDQSEGETGGAHSVSESEGDPARVAVRKAWRCKDPNELFWAVGFSSSLKTMIWPCRLIRNVESVEPGDQAACTQKLEEKKQTEEVVCWISSLKTTFIASVPRRNLKEHFDPSGASYEQHARQFNQLGKRAQTNPRDHALQRDFPKALQLAKKSFELARGERQEMNEQAIGELARAPRLGASSTATASISSKLARSLDSVCREVLHFGVDLPRTLAVGDRVLLSLRTGKRIARIVKVDPCPSTAAPVELDIMVPGGTGNFLFRRQVVQKVIPKDTAIQVLSLRGNAPPFPSEVLFVSEALQVQQFSLRVGTSSGGARSVSEAMRNDLQVAVREIRSRHAGMANAVHACFDDSPVQHSKRNEDKDALRVQQRKFVKKGIKRLSWSPHSSSEESDSSQNMVPSTARRSPNITQSKQPKHQSHRHQKHPQRPSARADATPPKSSSSATKPSNPGPLKSFLLSIPSQEPL